MALIRSNCTPFSGNARPMLSLRKKPSDECSKKSGCHAASGWILGTNA